MELNHIYLGDNRQILATLPDACVQTCITSPPYNVGKEYESQMPLQDYVNWLADLVPEYYRLLSDTGSIFFNIGSYIDKGKVFPIDCLLFEHFVRAGFYPRNRIIWTFGHGLHCANRFSGRHETILWFTKSEDYYFNLDNVRVPQKYPNKKHFKGEKKGQLSGNPLGKNPGDVWDITNVKHNHPEKTAHPCQFPEELVRRCLLATTRPGDIVLDPYIGSGTTAAVAIQEGRKFIGCEVKPEYKAIAERRIAPHRNQLFAA